MVSMCYRLSKAHALACTASNYCMRDISLIIPHHRSAGLQTRENITAFAIDPILVGWLSSPPRRPRCPSHARASLGSELSFSEFQEMGWLVSVAVVPTNPPQFPQRWGVKAVAMEKQQEMTLGWAQVVQAFDKGGPAETSQKVISVAPGGDE